MHACAIEACTLTILVLKDFVLAVILSRALTRALCSFTAGCIMELWRYRANSKQCKCPICGCLIVNLVLQPSLLIHPGDEVGKILRDIQLYNSMNLGGLSALLMVMLIYSHKLCEFVGETFFA